MLNLVKIIAIKTEHKFQINLSIILVDFILKEKKKKTKETMFRWDSKNYLILSNPAAYTGGSRELRKTMDFQKLIGLKIQVLSDLWFVFETEACTFTVSNIPT